VGHGTTLAGVTSSIERVDAADEVALRAIYDVWTAAYREEDPDNPLPTFPEIVARATAPSRSVVEEFWALRDGDDVVGCLWMEMPTQDNLEMAEIELAIHPRHQHRGHGRTLVAHLVARATELGRHQLITGTGEPPDGSESRNGRFAMAAGARRSLGEARRTLDLTSVDRGRLAELRAETEKHADGYQLVGWTGPAPDDLVDDYAALVGRMSTDAPLGDLGIEPEVWDAARIRERDAVIDRQGRTQVVTAARRGDDGPLVAFTDIVLTRHDPLKAFQWDTLVRREDRGHRLGTLVKIANLERLLDTAPEVQLVHTWNADTNSYMVAINELLGFRVARMESAWRLDVPRSGTAAGDA
jgi:GNAT superfamily N-acetyltransferase